MLKLLWADIKMLVRNKQALFWSLAFPLLFTIIFGLFFGGSNANVGTIGIVKNSDTEIANNLNQAIESAEIFKLQKKNSADEIKEAMRKNQISGGLLIPEGFGEFTQNSNNKIIIIEDPANAQVNSALTGFLQSYLTQVDYRINNIKPTFSIVEEKSSDKTINYFDFVLVGLIGLALMNSSIMGLAIGITRYREDKTLKRITTTPLKTWKFITAEVISRLFQNFLQVSIILIVAVFAFKAHITGSYWMLYLFALIGAILFQMMGFMIASLVRTSSAAEGMAQSIAIPMMFLAGVFFPIDALPYWFFSIVQFLPLAPLLRMLRAVALEAKTPFDNPLNILIVAGWIVIFFAIAVWKFRLSDE